jgi:hypothetical protein
VVQLHQENDKLKSAGVDLVVIGNGAPNFIEGFREQTKYDGPLYTDPSLATYKAAELKRGVGRTFDPRALGKTVSAFMKGHRQGRTQGDAFQQGGVLVVAPDGTIKFHHASERPGDHATVEQIIAAL